MPGAANFRLSKYNLLVSKHSVIFQPAHCHRVQEPAVR